MDRLKIRIWRFLPEEKKFLHQIYSRFIYDHAYLWSEVENLDLARLRYILFVIIKLFYEEHKNLHDVKEIDQQEFNRAVRELIASPDALMQKAKAAQIKEIDHLGLERWFNAFKKYIEKINEIIGRYEQNSIIDKNQELSPEEREALSKIIDFDAPENQKSIVFHVLDTKSNSSLVGGILNVEQVLEQGLLSKDIADRAGISRSKFGHAPESPFVNENPGISVANMKGFKGNAVTGAGIQKDFVLVIRVSEKDIVHFQQNRKDSRAGAGEEVLHRRVKPREIIGLDVRRKVLDLDIREFLSNIAPTFNFAMQLTQIARQLNIEIPNDFQELMDEGLKIIKKYEKARENIRSDLLSEFLDKEDNRTEFTESSYRGYIDRVRRKVDEHLDERTREINKLGEIAKDYSIKIAKKAKEIILPQIFEIKRFKGIRTVSDYLVYIGKLFKIPIYVEEELYWPRINTTSE